MVSTDLSDHVIRNEEPCFVFNFGKTTFDEMNLYTFQIIRFYRYLLYH